MKEIDISMKALFIDLWSRFTDKSFVPIDPLIEKVVLLNHGGTSNQPQEMVLDLDNYSYKMPARPLRKRLDNRLCTLLCQRLIENVNEVHTPH